MTPRFFATAADLRRWFTAHGATEPEVWIGYYKRESGRGGVSYIEAVEEALCHGWIDGQVRRIDDASYANRFTPRRPGSIWSRVNVQRVRQLERAGRMTAAGRRAFRARTSERTGVYNFERPDPGPANLDAPTRAAFAAHGAAYEFFERETPGRRRTVVRWIMSARRPATRARRLEAVIAWSTARRHVDLVHPFSFPRLPEGHGQSRRLGRRRARAE